MITPADSPSSPSDYAAVTPHGQGTAPYDIQAPQQDLAGVFEAAGRLTAGEENDIYPASPRQSAIAGVIKSPPGYQEFDIFPGFSGEGTTTHGWPNDVSPGA